MDHDVQRVVVLRMTFGGGLIWPKNSGCVVAVTFHP